MKELDKNTWKKIWYFVDDGIIYAIMVLSVALSSVILSSLAGKDVTMSDFNLSWAKLIVASFIGILVYGASKGGFQYTEKQKPPFFIRVYEAVKDGTFYQVIVSAGMDS